MNLLWTFIIIADIVMLLTVDPSLLLPSVTSAGRDSLALSFSLAALYFFWMGIMQIVKDAGLTDKLGRFVKPLIDRLYGKVNDTARAFIALNLASNLLGVGSAATPAALSAIEEMERERQEKEEKIERELRHKNKEGAENKKGGVTDYGEEDKSKGGEKFLREKKPVGKLPRSMAMLFVINATSIQLLPTTVMSLRASMGSLNAADIVLPTLIATIATTFLGIVLTSLMFKNDG